MSARIAVVGTGALGAPIGGLLTRAGHDVVMIDQWAAHVDAMKARGLRVRVGLLEAPDLDVTVPVRAYHVYEVAQLQPELDLVFLACKSYDTRWMAQLIAPYIKPDGLLVSVQNSLNDEWISPIVGRERDVGCVLTSGGGELLGPGDTWRDLLTNSFSIGELDGTVTPRLRGIAAIMGDAAVVTTTTNIWGLKWAKLVKNAMAGVLAGLTGLLSRELYDEPRCRDLAVSLGLEAVRVGVACGYPIEPVVPGVTIDDLLVRPEVLLARVPPVPARGKEARNFFVQDLSKGRRTEVDEINGLVCRKGAVAGVATPLNRRGVDLIHRMERGELRMDVSNVALLAA